MISISIYLNIKIGVQIKLLAFYVDVDSSTISLTVPMEVNFMMHGMVGTESSFLVSYLNRISVFVIMGVVFQSPSLLMNTALFGPSSYTVPTKI